MTVDSTGVPPPGRVPVERRWSGFDRRSILPVVLAFAVLFALVLPAIDTATP